MLSDEVDPIKHIVYGQYPMMTQQDDVIPVYWRSF